MAHSQLSALLDQLESALRQTGCWQLTPPSAEALASTAPFAIDSLSAEQWLQWVFIHKMRHILASGLPLPAALAITPYLQQALAEQNKPYIIIISERIDALFVD